MGSGGCGLVRGWTDAIGELVADPDGLFARPGGRNVLTIGIRGIHAWDRSLANAKVAQNSVSVAAKAARGWDLRRGNGVWRSNLTAMYNMCGSALIDRHSVYYDR